MATHDTSMRLKRASGTRLVPFVADDGRHIMSRVKLLNSLLFFSTSVSL